MIVYKNICDNYGWEAIPESGLKEKKKILWDSEHQTDNLPLVNQLDMVEVDKLNKAAELIWRSELRVTSGSWSWENCKQDTKKEKKKTVAEEEIQSNVFPVAWGV